MDNKFRLHTPEELQKIAEDNFDRFQEIAKEYYHKDKEFYVANIRPILNKINEEKNKIKNIAKSNLSTKQLPPISIKELKELGIDIQESKLSAESSKGVIFCISCGEKNNIESNFCFNCGKQLLKDIELEKVVSNQIEHKKDNNSEMWIIIGFLAALVSIFFFPIPFGLFGVFCGYKATTKGSEGAGAFIVILSILCGAAGVILGLNSVSRHF
jgi:hypothetical protein